MFVLLKIWFVNANGVFILLNVSFVNANSAFVHLNVWFVPASGVAKIRIVQFKLVAERLCF